MKYKILTCIIFIYSTITVAQSDTTPPVLNSISIDKDNITIDEEATITVNAIDDISGIRRIDMNIVNSIGEQQQVFGGEIVQKWNNLGSNNYSTSLKISNDFLFKGEWYMRFIILRDNADNSITINYEKSTSPLKFNLESLNSDTTPPVLNSISIDKDNITIDEEATITVNAIDDISGIRRIDMNIVNSIGEQQQVFGGEIIQKWNNLGSNNYSTSLKISNDFLLKGEWYMRFIILRDNADNPITINYEKSTSPLKFNLNDPTLSLNGFKESVGSFEKINNSKYIVNSYYGSIKYYLYSITGQLILTNRSFNNEIILKEGINPGIYILNAKLDHSVFTKKIIIK